MSSGLGEYKRTPIYNNLRAVARPGDCPENTQLLSSMSEHEDEFDGTGSYDLAVEEARPKVKQPPLYRVILVNDDYTPMEFVVDILETIFSMERTRATQVMLEVHTKGKGVCGVFNFEIAETKVAQVTALAQQHQHPLLCTMEES